MSDKNIELLRRAWEAYDRGDEEGFASCLTEDWREFDTRGDSATIEDERPTMRLHREAFPNKHTEIHRIVANNGYVACQCTTTATHTGQYLDAEPTGKVVQLHEMMFNRIRDGRICETWAMVDDVGFYEQITGRTIPQTLDNMG